jgi:hypothetical protein
MANPLTLLDQETPPQDPLAGTEIGSCEVVGSLVPGTGSALLAFKLDLSGASETVLLHKLEETGQPPPAALADAEDAAALKDSHLERVFGVEATAHGSFWVTEYVPGATLDEIRTACKTAGMSLPMGFGLAAVADAALGLQQLHARPNPQNPLRPRAHGLLRPQHIVVQFGGSAKLLNPRYLKLANSSAHDDAMTGNAGYLSPESIRGAPVDPRSDVFSLAVLVHEFLTGKILFNGRTPRERADATLKGAQVAPSKLNLSLSPQVDDAVMKALNLEPGQRYANAGDFHRALRSAVGPYMWKEAQRAEFMERIFSTRSRQTKALAIRMKEREAAAIARLEEERRQAEQARLAAEAAKAAAEEAARVAKQQAEEAARLAAQKAEAEAKARAAAAEAAAKAAARKPVQMIALAGVPAVLVLALIGWFLLRSSEPPPVVIVTPPTPVAAVDAGTDAGVDGGEAGDGGELDGGPSDGGTDDGGTPDAGPPKKKKKSNDVQLPPWLRH